MDDSHGEAPLYDLAVIGGGINGCGIAADAAGRGLSVLLVEQGDLAVGTSSASSKLIHGGLRYLEQYAFRLVKESLEEREVLLANAPHIVWPLRFVVPHVPAMRSRMAIRAGLFLYDHLARRRRIPGSSLVDLARSDAGRVLSPLFSKGFSYFDCWVDDARLVVLVARLAARHGAQIETRTKLVSAIAASDSWHLTLGGRRGTHAARARMLVNAAGPWAGRVARERIRRGDLATEIPVRLVKGSHIVVPRLAGAETAYLLQASDRRIIFLLPFAERFTLIGTTDVPFDGDPAEVAISDDEERYLIGEANAFLAKPIGRENVVWRFAGVRPLFDDASDNPSTVTRDYKLALDAPGDGPVLLTVVGGKVTTYRRLAESALELLTPYAGRPLGKPWTKTAALPGGDIGGGDFAAFAKDFMARYPVIPAKVLMPLMRRYGTDAADVLGDSRTVADLGVDLGGGLFAREIRYLAENEWAMTAEDVLWRRTKAGLEIPARERMAAEQRIAAILAK